MSTNTTTVSRVTVTCCTILTTLTLTFVLAMVWTTTAFAAYEQEPEHFGASGEAKELEKASAMAVNVSGAGGVQAGSFYVVGKNDRVARFAPGAEGKEPRFEEAWGWGIAEGGPSKEYVRCGPAYHGTANPAENTYEHCRSLEGGGGGGGNGGEEPGNFAVLGGVAVDRTTGNVYVRNANQEVAGALVRAHHLIEVFTPRGTPVGEGFGDSGNPFSVPPESIAEGPEKLHRIGTGESPIAVDSTGAVYVLDKDYASVGNEEMRLMVFRPCTAGDYESYCYAAGEDISLQGWESDPFQISLVGNDKVVVASAELIREYPLGGHNPAPTCSRVVSGQLFAMTTDPLSGDVFYYRFLDRSIRHLGPCDQATGEFTEIQKLKPEPRPPGHPGITALAVDPSLVWGPTRPAGVLYAADAEDAIGDVFAPAEVSPPEVQSESVASTTTVSTLLQARIDPLGQATKYTFQYLTLAQYEEDGGFASGVSEVPANPGEIPSGETETVTTGVSGLAPDTSYVFRVLASGFCNPERPEEVCRASGKPAFFATYPLVSSGLPDGRAYELVSPPEKNGGEVFPAEPRIGSCEECKPPGGQLTAVDPMQAAPGGSAVAYMGYPFFPGEGSAVYNAYVSRRGADAWNTTAISPALLATRGAETLAYNPQLTEDVILQSAIAQLAPRAPVGDENLYLQNVSDPALLTPLVTTIPPHRADGSLAIAYGGHSPDFSAQFFAANDALTAGTAFAPEPPDPGSGGRDLYEWRDGVLSLVNILPGNAGIATNPAFASASPDAHGVSANGRRVFWQANGHLYVRENRRVTREITHQGTFLSASEDGMEILLSDGCLYSLASEECTDLTQGQGGFEGLVGLTGDFSHLYFVDSTAITGSGKNERLQEPQTGQPNLYLHEAGIGTRFVATLATTDNEPASKDQPNDWALLANQRTAEASPDGRYLAFASRAQLTGYDNVGLCGLFTNQASEIVPVDAPCAEVFVYDSVTGRLFCASCNPTGEAPRGFSTLRWIGGSGGSAWIPQPRYVTDQGQVFFDSQDRLSPRDVNGRVEDVYEAEPAGVGSCKMAGGCVLLISQGTGGVDSNFLAMDENGANVFFTTRDRLAPTDTDELLDVYDAREGGGLPDESEVTAVSECDGEPCPSTITDGSLVTSGLASVVFQGAGNVGPEASPPDKPVLGKPPSVKPVVRCPRGKVKEKSKCVDRKKQAKQRKARAKRKQKQAAAGRKRGGSK
jgi:hypothetical protein